MSDDLVNRHREDCEIEKLKAILEAHQLWLKGQGGSRADLRGADLESANLESANLESADLLSADLRSAKLRGADLRGADLWGADLESANLESADLRGANLWSAKLWNANLRGADLRGANLLCSGNMREIRTMQIDTWAIGYTADTLQIGCQKHSIDKWRKWDTPAGRKWIESMDEKALDWADRNLALVLAMIDANPATPTGHEEKHND